MLSQQMINNLQHVTKSDEMQVISVTQLKKALKLAIKDQKLNRFCNFTAQHDVKGDLSNIDKMEDSYAAFIKYHNQVMLVPLHREDSEKIQMADILKALKKGTGMKLHFMPFDLNKLAA